MTSWRSRGCSEKGFEREESKHLAAEDWAHCYSCAAARAAHLKAEGERERSDEGVRRKVCKEREEPSIAGTREAVW